MAAPRHGGAALTSPTRRLSPLTLLHAALAAASLAPAASTATRHALRRRRSSPTGVRLAIVAALVAAVLAVPAVASADTFCVHNPSGCAGSAKQNLQDALLAASANGAGKDTIKLGAGSFTDGPAVAAAGNPVEIVGASAQDTTLVGTGNNITVLTLLDAASTVSNLGVKITGTGGETGIKLAGTGSDLKMSPSSPAPASPTCATSGRAPTRSPRSAGTSGARKATRTPRRSRCSTSRTTA